MAKIRTVSIDTQEAPEGFKWAAMQDARMQDAINRSLYTLAQRNFGARVEQALALCYSTDLLRLNYRKKTISIKVAKPFVVTDRRNLRLLEAEWAALGIYKKDSAQGITYCIPR